MEEQSFSSALVEYIKKRFTDLREWLRPEPEDPLFLKILKGFFKAIAVLILTVFSPVVLLILIVAFFAAF